MIYKISLLAPSTKPNHGINARTVKEFYLTDLKCNERPVCWCDNNIETRRAWAYRISEVCFLNTRGNGVIRKDSLICSTQNF